MMVVVAAACPFKGCVSLFVPVTRTRGVPLSQLILPESLKYLPLNIAAALKLDAFGQNNKAMLVRCDLVAAVDLYAMRTAATHVCCLLFV